jgi:hypothetical protein
MWRWRMLMFLCGLVLLVDLGVWGFSRLAWPEAVSIALGVRQYRDDYDFICGLSSRGNEIWYYPTVIPIGWDLTSHVRTVQSHRAVSVLDFQYAGYRPTPVDWYYIIGIPLWFVAIISGAGLAVSIRKFRRLIRLRMQGRCGKCGYDLRASSERCPECGTVVARPSTLPAQYL